MQHDGEPMLIDLATSSRESSPATVDLVSPSSSPADIGDLLQSDSESCTLEVSLDTTGLVWPEPLEELMVYIRAAKAEDTDFGINIKLHREIWSRTIS